MCGACCARRLCGSEKTPGLPYGSLRGRALTAAPSRGPDAERQRQPQASGEAAGGHGRGGSGFPPSSGLGGQTDVGTERAEGGRRVNGALASGSLSCTWPAGRRARTGSPERLPEQRGQTHSGPRFLLGARERPGSQEACPGMGGRAARPPPEVGAAGPRLGRPGLARPARSPPPPP